MKRNGFLRSVVLVLSLAGSVSLAYVLPQGSILRRMAEARDDLQLTTLKVEGAMSFAAGTLPVASSSLGVPPAHGELRADATLSMRVPGRCRLDLSRLDGKTVSVVTAGGKRKTTGGEIPAAIVALEEACAIFAARGSSDADTRAQIENHLRTLGVESRLSSLGRFGGHVAYVLGNPDETKPQFWVYKDSFRPARLKFTDKGGKAWDVRFLDYTSPMTGDWFPRTLEVWSGEERHLRLTALKGDNRVKLADDLFQ